MRLALAILALALFPTVAAQEGATPVLVEDLDATYAPRVEAGTEPVEFRWRLHNIDSNTPYFVRVTLRPLPGWEHETTPNGFFLAPLAEANVTLRLEPAGRVPERTDFTVTFSLVDSDTGVAFQVQRAVSLVATESVLVLGLFPNPLPAPLDNVYGVFLLDVLFWVVVVGVAAMWASDALLRMFAAKMPHDALRNVVARLRRAVLLLVAVVGIERSFRVLPAAESFGGVSTTLRVAIVVLTAVVVFRVFGAVLEYYASVVAARTSTTLDDVLVPVLRKIAAVIVSVVAIAFVLDVFGFNLNIVFGAAGIAGLVIAFAAQDTLSNFFSGIFLLVDRPFTEGDDVQIETGEVCRVDNVGLRSTRLYHYRNHEIIVLPNNQLASRKVVNLTAPNRRFRMFVNVGVAYGTDVRRVKGVLDRVLRSHPEVVVEPDNQPFVMLEKFGESSLDFLLIFLVKDVKDRGRIAAEVREAVLDAFAQEGIEIPFPHRTLIVKGDAPDARA